MAARAKPTIAPDKLARYDELIASVQGLARKGASMPYTSVTGHMFSFLDKDGNLGLRLPENLRHEFISRYNTALCEAHVTILKEYVLVPDGLFAQREELARYFTQSYQYVNLLKPKKKQARCAPRPHL